MSATEEACRWSIVQAWCCWAHRRTQRWHLVAYGRALGLEPTDPPREDRP